MAARRALSPYRSPSTISRATRASCRSTPSIQTCAATIAQADRFYATLDARAEDEAAQLRARGVRLVVADAPPLGCAAAARAGIPSVVVSNFTWDWIYAEYREYLDSAPELIPTIQAAYRLAEAAWRLPMHGGFETFSGARI